MADITKKYPNLSTGGGLFLKLADGDTVKVRLMSDPIYFDNDFKGDLTSRIAWVIWNHDESKAQIWATNGATYNSIKDLVSDEEYGDPTQYDIKITRTGTMQQTRYSVRPGTQRNDPTGEMKKACEAIDPIEIIGRSETAQHVMYLEEHRKQKDQQGSQKAVTANEPEDEPTDSEMEEPINLDDIPF